MRIGKKALTEGKIKVQLFIFLVMMISFIKGFGFSSVYAATQPVSWFPIQVQPIFPHNQQKQIQNYFDLSGRSGQVENVLVELKNLQKNAIKVDITSTNALTAINGGIEYSKFEQSPWTWLLNDDFAIRGLIRPEKSSVILRPGQRIDIPVRIQFPKARVGSYLGGIEFSTVIHQTIHSRKASVQVQNQMNHVIAVQENLPVAGIPAFAFGDTKLRIIPSGAELMIRMSNPSPTVLHAVAGNFVVRNLQNQIVFQGKFGPFSMAPESTMYNPEIWDGQLYPGSYSISLVGGPPTNKVQLSSHFKLSESVLTQNMSPFEKLHFRIMSTRIPMWVWILLFVLFFLLLLLLLKFFKVRQPKRQQSKHRKSKHRKSKRKSYQEREEFLYDN